MWGRVRRRFVWEQRGIQRELWDTDSILNEDNADDKVFLLLRSIPSQGNTAEVALTVFHRNFLGVRPIHPPSLSNDFLHVLPPT